MSNRKRTPTGRTPRPDTEERNRVITTHRLISDGGGRERVLIPLPILEGQGVPGGLPELLSTADVILLGYHVVPEQTPPDMMRQQYEEQAQKSLAQVAETFREAGGDADTRLVFTHDREQTVDRVLAETHATAFLLPRTVASVDTLLVPLRGEVDAARVARFVARLRGDRDVDVTLYAATKEGDDAAAAAAANLIDVAAETLADLGVPVEAISERTAVTDAPTRAVIEEAIAHDAVVMGKREPDWRSLIFGELHDQIADESLGPVFVVGGADG